jgi:hypothetical protein
MNIEIKKNYRRLKHAFFLFEKIFKKDLTSKKTCGKIDLSNK